MVEFLKGLHYKKKNKQLKKQIIICLIFFTPICSAFSQENKFAFHISNPLGMFHKVGVKLEFRSNRIGFLLTGTKYYFTDFTPYSGKQFGGEVRLYSKKIKEQNYHENFLYIKRFSGNVDYYKRKSAGGFSPRAILIPASNYYGIGGGIGKHLSFKHLFIDLNVGGIYSVPEVKQDRLFYGTGPGSYLDLKLNLGYQF